MTGNKKTVALRSLCGVALLAIAGCGVAPEGAAAPEQGYLGADAWSAVDNPVKTDTALEARITSILRQMSVEEKVGQILQPEIQYVTPDDIRTYHIGSVLNGGGSLPNRNKHATPAEWLAMADAFYEASMDASDGGTPIPIIWGSDAVHGHNNVVGATIFPHNIGLGAANNPGLIRKIGEITALEMRVTGIDWTFAPTLAVAQNDRWGRTYESYSENPQIVQAYAGQMVLGLQGKPGTDTFLDVNHVVATAKHFLGDGGTENGDDQGDAKVPEAELRDIHGAGYFSAMAAGAQTAMASFSSWNGQKMHGSKYLLTDVLKGRLGLDGLIVGDWNGHGQLPGCTNASCAEAINAGLDLFMVPQDWKDLYTNTLAQVRDGTIPMTRLDDAVSRILRVKLRAGLFEKGLPSTRGVAGQTGIIGQDAHRAVARQAVRESLVLLKNAGGLLPLQPQQTILVTGDGAHNIGKQSGGWTITWQGTGNSNADFPGASSIFQGIEEAVTRLGGKAILSPGGHFEQKPDVAIVVFGEEPYAEFQGDRDTLEFEPGNKRSLALLKKLKAAGIPVVSVFLSGRPMWTNPEINASDAFVAAWLPGSEGAGVADVLIADKEGQPRHDFKGRLSFSWPKTPVQDILNPHHENYDPLFPFGYGLSYTSGQTGPENLPEEVEGVLSDQGDELAIFVGRPQAPWQVYITGSGAGQLLSGPYAALPGGGMTVEASDKDVQGDALTVVWAGGEKGRVSIQAVAADEHYNFSDMLKAGGFVSMDVRLDELPEKELYFKLECGSGCARSVALGDHLRSHVGQGWQRLSFGLSCLAAEGDMLDRVNVPFAIETTGKASLSFANVKVQTTGPATLNCVP